jgi:hypothetical protein
VASQPRHLEWCISVVWPRKALGAAKQVRFDKKNNRIILKICIKKRLKNSSSTDSWYFVEA